MRRPPTASAASTGPATSTAPPSPRAPGPVPAAIAPAVLGALGALTMLGPFGTDAYLPALPSIRTDLAAAAGATQLTLTGYSVGMAIGQLVAGPVSDAIGRRRPLLAGSAGMVVGGLIGALAGNLVILVIGCFVMGVCAAVGIVAGRAVVADLASGPALTRGYALLGTLTGLGPVLGPLGGVALMTLFGWRGIFAGLAVAAAACCAAVAAIVPESLPPSRRVRGGLRAMAGNAGTALRSRGYLCGATVIWFGFGGLFAYIAASAFVVQAVLGFSPTVYSIVFAANGIGLIVAGLVCARLTGRCPDRTLIGIGLAMESAGMLLVAVATVGGWVSPLTILPGMFLIAASMGFIFGPATSSALAGLRHVAGTALAILGAIQFVVAGVVSPLVELRPDTGPFALVGGVCVTLAWAGFVAFRPGPAGGGAAPVRSLTASSPSTEPTTPPG